MAEQYDSFSSKEVEAEVPTCHAVAKVQLPATAQASTVNLIAEVSHIKNKQTKSSSICVVRLPWQGPCSWSSGTT